MTAAFLAPALLLVAAATPLQAQRQDEMAVGANITIDDLRAVDLAPRVARPGADLMIVYFVDYACGACRRFSPDVLRVVAADRRLEVVVRDTPIFGVNSHAAARAAIAAGMQQRHWAMHHALMKAKLPLDDQAIRGAAMSAGVNWPRLQRDLKAHGARIDAQLARNMAYSQALGCAGTPCFVIGDRMANGALDQHMLTDAIRQARRAKR